MERVVYHVVPGPSGWVIRAKSNGVSEIASRKEDAIARARELAHRVQLSQVVIHTADGEIEKEYSYGDES